MMDPDPNEDALYAVALPPIACARDVLENPAFAAALGYGWLHEEDTDFTRAFRERVARQAELYQNWLNRE